MRPSRSLVALLIPAIAILSVHCGNASSGTIEASESELNRDAGAKVDEIVLEADTHDSFPDGNEVTFRLPEHVAGFQVVAEGLYARILSLHDPNGRPLVEMPAGSNSSSDNRVIGGTTRNLRPAESELVDAISVPMHGAAEALSPAAGIWKMRIRCYDPTTHVRVVLRRTSDGLPKPGLLDLAVYIPDGVQLDGEPLTTANAATSGPLAKRLDAFDEKLEAYWGIRLGRRQYVAIDERYVHISEDDEFGVGKATTVEGPVMHLVVSEENGMFWASSTGLPAPVATPGTQISQVILASKWRSKTPDQYDANAAQEGNVLAHEAGHYLGLFHTSEMTGTVFDPLSDTPECDPTILAAGRNGCPDFTNVMFGGGSVTATVTSPLQRRIVQSSPLLRGTSITR